jgi:hypothetical protein
LLSSPFWQKGCRQIQYVLPQDGPENYFPLCFFGATHHIQINIGHWARLDEMKLATARTKLLNAITHDGLDSRTLYVFESAALWKCGMLRMRSGDWAGVFDGFRAIAPAWAALDNKTLLSLLKEVMPEYRLGACRSFMVGREGSRYWGTDGHSPSHGASGQIRTVHR